MNDEEHRKRKYILLAVIALLIAFLAFFLAQIAEDQAIANNQSKLNVPPSPCTNFTFLQTFNGTSTICNNVPLQGTLTYFFDNETSLNTVNASKRMNQTPNTTETIKLYPNVPNNQSIQNWTTKQGFPALSFIPAGEFLVHIHASKGASGQAHIYFNIWEVNNTGVWIREIGTTEHGLLTTSEAEYELVYVAPDTIFLNSTLSRIMVQTEIHVLSGSPDVTLYFGGTADSKLKFPSVTVDATNFVPYTGATLNVDLGINDLNATNITASNISLSNGVSIGSLQSSKVSKSGDTMTGDLDLPGINVTHDYTKNPLMNISNGNGIRMFTDQFAPVRETFAGNVTTTMFMIFGNLNSERMTVLSFNSTSQAPSFQGVGGSGNYSFPTALQSGQALISIAGAGIDNQSNVTGNKVALIGTAENNWLTTNEGAYWSFQVTKTGGTARAETVRFIDDNISVIRPGGVIILKSPDGTKCGILQWTNAGGFATSSITCP